MSEQKIRILPEQAERVETGCVQFGDDWPGVFIRGDNAAGLAMYLRDAQDPFYDQAIRELLNLLEGSRVRH